MEHLKPTAMISRMDVETADGVVRRDYQRAHEAAGDPGFETSIPGTCWSCYAKEIAQAEAELAAKEAT